MLAASLRDPEPKTCQHREGEPGEDAEAESGEDALKFLPPVLLDDGEDLPLVGDAVLHVDTQVHPIGDASEDTLAALPPLPDGPDSCDVGLNNVKDFEHGMKTSGNQVMK